MKYKLEFYPVSTERKNAHYYESNVHMVSRNVRKYYIYTSGAKANVLILSPEKHGCILWYDEYGHLENFDAEQPDEQYKFKSFDEAVKFCEEHYKRYEEEHGTDDIKIYGRFEPWMSEAYKKGEKFGVPAIDSLCIQQHVECWGKVHSHVNESKSEEEYNEMFVRQLPEKFIFLSKVGFSEDAKARLEDHGVKFICQFLSSPIGPYYMCEKTSV